jgi:hypothetical protein
LPAEAATWDLSNLIIDGQALQRSTVIKWLDICYKAIHDRPYGDPKQQTQPATMAIRDCSVELFMEQLRKPTQHMQPVISATQLYHLLAFADAVGSTRGVIRECVAVLDKLRVEVTVGEQVVQLGLDSTPSYFAMSRSKLPDALFQGSNMVHSFSMAPEHVKQSVSPNTTSDAAAEVAAQVEQLLFIAHKLQLQDLRQRVHAFITAAAAAPVERVDPVLAYRRRPLLSHSMLSPAVYSARVCEAAGYTQEQAAAAWASSLHQVQLLGMGNSQHRPLLKLVDSKPAAMEFKAELQDQDFAGIACNSQVDVVLDIAGGRPTMKVTTSTTSNFTNNGGRHVSYAFPVDIFAHNA